MGPLEPDTVVDADARLVFVARDGLKEAHGRVARHRGVEMTVRCAGHGAVTAGTVCVVAVRTANGLARARAHVEESSDVVVVLRLCDALSVSDRRMYGRVDLIARLWWRRLKRAESPPRLIAIGEGDVAVTTAVELSPAGMRVALDGDWAEGDRLLLHMRIADADVRVTAEVRRLLDGGDLALAFTQVDDDTRNELARVVDEAILG